MKLAPLVWPLLAAAAFVAADAALYERARGDPLPANATPAAATGPDTKPKEREKEAVEQLQRDRIRRQIILNIDRLKHCLAPAGACVANDLPRLLLGLTRSEIEAILGPPLYQLRLAGNHLFYWTVPLPSNRPAGAVRVQVSFGDCYYREKDSKQKAVCDASVP